MRRFADLYAELDETTKSSRKIAAMANYFRTAPASDSAWAIYFLGGRRLRQPVPTRLLRTWAAEAAGIEDWLFDECYNAVGDLAETITLIVPPGTAKDEFSLTEFVEQTARSLRILEPEEQRRQILELWAHSETRDRFAMMKLLTGSFRVGVSARLVTRALAESTGLPAETLAHRLMGRWEPSAEFFQRLVDPDTQDTVTSQPYPFCLAHGIDSDVGPEPLGGVDEFLAEWKWDGIRGQLIRRESLSFVWSRGEELMENRWPEIETAATHIPDGTVLDGEILAVGPDDSVLPFNELQRRINRKTISKKLLREVPVQFRAFDLLEIDGQDIRQLPLLQRRERLESVMQSVRHPALKITEVFDSEDWPTLAAIRETSRENNAEGLMLKHRDSVYEVGRTRGAWWKWKIEPYTIDAVLIYAQRGHGKRASLYTDYTFAVWDNDTLVPFAKAYSGLDDAEIRKVDRFVRGNTLQTFGPVRSVKPELVMELAFEGLQQSNRHKSGVAVRFPRIARWRHDKSVADANTLQDLWDLAGRGTTPS
jgi:DNA ligase-1